MIVNKLWTVSLTCPLFVEFQLFKKWSLLYKCEKFIFTARIQSSSHSLDREALFNKLRTRIWDLSHAHILYHWPQWQNSIFFAYYTQYLWHSAGSLIGSPPFVLLFGLNLEMKCSVIKGITDTSEMGRDTNSTQKVIL